MRHWTREEVETAIRDKEARGIPYKETAERLGVNYGAFRVLLHKYRSGKLNWGRSERRARRLKVIEPLLASGAGIVEIADRFGLSKEAADSFCRYHGYDAEVRRLYREGEGA